MIKRRALRASAFHFLFNAEGRVTPGQGGRLGIERESSRERERPDRSDFCFSGKRQGHPGVGHFAWWALVGVGCLG